MGDGGSGLLCCLRALARVSLSSGIVGLPNVGESTLFNALTKFSARRFDGSRAEFR